MFTAVGTTAGAQPRAQADEDTASDSWTEPANPAAAGEDSAMLVFARAEAEYQAARYASCSALLTQLFRRAGGPGFPTDEHRDEARHYAFACAHLNGDAELAEEHVNAGFRDNPAIENPDAYLFRPNVVDRFIEIRVAGEEDRRKAATQAQAAEQAEIERREELQRERAVTLEELKLLAGAEPVIQKNERWMAAVPFGVGQFQNRSDALGWLFLTSEVLLVATAVTGTIIELDQHAQLAADPRLDRAQANRILASAQTAEIVGGWGFLAMAVIGIVEAQLNFVPEFEEAPRARELPERLQSLEATDRPKGDWRPTFRASDEGGEVGVVLSF